jgi:hypothetical protein
MQVARIMLDTLGWESEWKNKKKKLSASGSNVKCHELFHIIFVPNKHMPFGGEQLVFGLAHIFWWVYGI